MNIPYHSALAAGKLEEGAPLAEPYCENECWVMVWDVNDRAIPDPYHRCDLLYAEPSWPAGLKNFDARAGVETSSFRDYALSVRHIIETLNVPTVMFVGAQAQRLLPIPDYSIEADLNGNLTPVCFWNGAMASGASNKDIIRDLAQHYNVVGDFCCGYGTTGRLFKEAGREFVMSDYNAQVCGYVAANMDGWNLL